MRIVHASATRGEVNLVSVHRPGCVYDAARLLEARRARLISDWKTSTRRSHSRSRPCCSTTARRRSALMRRRTSSSSESRRTTRPARWAESPCRNTRRSDQGPRSGRKPSLATNVGVPQGAVNLIKDGAVRASRIGSSGLGQQTHATVSHSPNARVRRRRG